MNDSECCIYETSDMVETLSEEQSRRSSYYIFTLSTDFQYGMN
jgi:hypothetical protein